MALSGKAKSVAYRLGRRYANSRSATEISRISKKEYEITDTLSDEDRKSFQKWIERGRVSNLEKSTDMRYRRGRKRGRKRRTVPSHLRSITKQ